MKAIYLRKGFFESSKKFEIRVNTAMAIIESDKCESQYELRGTCAGDKYIILYYEIREEQIEEEKKSVVVTEFKKQKTKGFSYSSVGQSRRESICVNSISSSLIMRTNTNAQI